MFNKKYLGFKMNDKERMILRYLKQNEKKITQRELASRFAISLGSVNQLLQRLIDKDLLNQSLNVSGIQFEHPKQAIILAAGFGMRMVPINTEYPKGLLEVKGEPLIERLIKQLHEVGVQEIRVVVGFMKEHYEYLIDDYGVSLVVNPNYSEKKNLYSLGLACQNSSLASTYIVPCDVYCQENPFAKDELGSWYMVSDEKVVNSDVRIHRNFDLVPVKANEKGNKMVGIAYIAERDGQYYTDRLAQYVASSSHDNEYWETIFDEGNTYRVAANLISADRVREINTYEELRELDGNSNQLNNATIQLISQVLKVSNDQISQITVLKKGMTNRSFLFACQGKKYIMRIPGEGANELIDRQKEAAIYRLLEQHSLTENVLYLNPDNGYKLTEFVSDAHNCNPLDDDDLQKCMATLKSFHDLSLKANFEFDLYQQIDFYEQLRGSQSSYRDYDWVKERVLGLKSYLDSLDKQWTLCHIDANPDNFLIEQNGHTMLIDWEYAAMQDPDLDVAMFAIYALYDRQQTDHLLDLYYNGKCESTVRLKVYAYMATCGLLWSNWCEYKNTLGVDFGEYSLRQYRYAKEYSKLVYEILEGKADA